MKSAESKSSATQAAKTTQPFFNRGSGRDAFFKQGPGAFKSGPDAVDSSGGPGAVQAKLTIGQPNDQYEQEADAVADKVVQRLSKNEPSQPHAPASGQTDTVQAKPMAPAPLPAITPLVQAKPIGADKKEELQLQEEEKETDLQKGKLQRKPIFESNAEPPDEGKNIQRKCAHCEKEEKLQKKPADGAGSPSPSVESSLNHSKGSGHPLPADTRAQMEDSIGADFSGVRVHNDNRAVKMSEDLNAQAFTHGNDIYFNAGKYDAASTEGRHLLAHELTHTVQQGGSVRRKENIGETAATPAAPLTVSSEVVDISHGTFNPSEKVKKEIEEAKKSKSGGLDVRIRTGPYATASTIKVKKDGEAYNAIGHAYLPLTNVWLQKIPGLVLRTDIQKNVVTGYVTVKGADNAKAFINAIKKAESAIGMGFHFKNAAAAPTVTNKLENGTLSLGFSDFTITIGGFFDLKLNLTLENLNTPVFEGSATMKLKGAEGKVDVNNKTQGLLGGSGSLAISFSKFSGLLEVKYDPLTGAVDIHGKVAYSGDKLTGSIDLVSTDVKTANSFAKDAIKAAGGIEKAQDAAMPAAVPAPSGTTDRGLAGVGQLEFHLTDWFAGTVNVIVDAEGHVTVIGKIAPPAEITLFKQRDWDNELFKLEAKAYYGIPVLGNLNLFANVSLHSIAKLGPAKIYNIEIIGTYSTDPTVQKSIQIAGSINISGYAGLRLRAEGGAGIELARHDLKFGIGVNADVGVDAYADARPTIGWREPGEFYISGTLELVAQPMLGLGGDFFIKLETPWWSPISDHTWTWPLFSKQWPLGDPIGLSAEVKDYVLGSGKVPEITFKPPKFDPAKFMTSMVDDNLPDKAGGANSGHSSFKEDGTVQKPELPDPKKAKKDAAEKGKSKDKKGGPPLPPAKAKPEQKPDPEIVKLFEVAGKKLQGIKDPITKADLRAKLDGIEKSTPGIKFSIQQEGEKWVVSSMANKHPNPHPVKFGAILTDADKKAGKSDTIEAAIGEINQEGKQKIADGEVTKKDADDIAADVRKDHPSVIQSINVLDGGKTWDFKYVQKAAKDVISISKTAGPNFKIGEYYKNKAGIFVKVREIKADGYAIMYNIQEDKEMKFTVKLFNEFLVNKTYEPATEAEVSKITPAKRYLPASWAPTRGTKSLRYWMYETHGWGTKRDAFNKEHLDKPGTGIKAKIWAVINNKTDLVWRTNEWKKMKDPLHWVESKADIDNYDPDAVKYNVDHDPDLWIRWNGGDKNSNDNVRKDHVLNDNYLFVATREFNLSKHSEDYHLYVEKDFESTKLNSPKNGKTIDGERFLDKLPADGGKPIP